MIKNTVSFPCSLGMKNISGSLNTFSVFRLIEKY